MQRIHKYMVPTETVDWVAQIPKGATVFGFEKQGNYYVFWANVDVDAALVPRRFLLLTTGQSHPCLKESTTKWCGTLQEHSGDFYFVLHLFDAGEL